MSDRTELIIQSEQDTCNVHDSFYQLSLDCVKRDYDFILTVNVASHLITQVIEGNIVNIINQGSDYDETATRIIKQNIKSPNPSMLLGDISLKNVIETLSKKPYFEFRFFGNNMNGRPFVREINYSYRDETNSEIFVTCKKIIDRSQDDANTNRKLTAALNSAVRASEAKSEFLSRMSHDMRTPLNGIIGMTELALSENNPDTVKSYLEQVSTSGKFLLVLINDILDMARIENGKLELHPERYYQREFIDYIKAVASPLCAAKNQHLNIDIDEFDSAFVADKLRLNQIFFNLLSNASKYTPEGGDVSFTVRHKSAGWESVYGKINLYCEVRDNGIGISKPFLQYIFTPFSREETGVSAKTQGSGLGLSIVKSLVEMMHGKIDIESEPGKGTKVTIVLVFPLAEDIYEENGSTITQSEKANLAGKRILIAEDNQINADLLKILLSKLNIKTECAKNGYDALQMFMENETGYFDAILMDVRMPIMDGIRATKSIRALTRRDAQDIPIIAVTANAFDADVKTCLEAGMNAHISKPIENEKLFTVLENFIK